MKEMRWQEWSLLLSSLVSAILAAVLWWFGLLPWWAIIVGLALPTLIVGAGLVLFVALWMASGSH